LAQAAGLGAGSTTAPDPDDVELVVVCAPPDATATVIAESLDVFSKAAVTDVASLKSSIFDQVHEHAHARRYIGGHPLAGRETSGPGGARSDLFEGRPWVLTPLLVDENRIDQKALETVRTMVSALAATIVEMDPLAHDEAVAAVSHVPQVMASLTAARLNGLDATSLSLSGQGIRDVTRIAASDAQMWSQIIGGNAEAVVSVLDGVAADLAALRASLTTDASQASAAVQALVERGNQGRSLIPGKHGATAQRYAMVPVVIPDQPGALARLFDVVGGLGVSIEDLALEHSPGQPVGLATLSVVPAASAELMDGLEAGGWVVHR